LEKEWKTFVRLRRKKTKHCDDEESCCGIKLSWLPNYYVALVKIQRLADEDLNEFVLSKAQIIGCNKVDKILTVMPN
jgi:hypothetical protein